MEIFASFIILYIFHGRAVTCVGFSSSFRNSHGACENKALGHGREQAYPKKHPHLCRIESNSNLYPQFDSTRFGVGSSKVCSSICGDLQNFICNAAFRQLLQYGIRTSWTERLTKQCIRVKKVDLDFEEREQYVVLEWYKAPVADL
jgi:hypothetical protein